MFIIAEGNVLIMKVDYISRRLTEIRMKQNISEYKMSLDLGHSRSYIQSISSGRAMPSMGEFLYICEYLGITPQQFFSEDIENPVLLDKAIAALKKLNEQDLLRMIDLAERLAK